MDQQTIIADFEARAAAIGTTMSAICDRAGVHRTTFSRWKKSERNPDPIGANLETLGKLGAALDEAEAEAEAHAQPDTSAADPASGGDADERTPRDAALDAPLGAAA